MKNRRYENETGQLGHDLDPTLIMSQTVRAVTAPSTIRSRTVSEALGINERHKIPGYVGHVPGKDSCIGIRYAEATRRCLEDFDAQMERTRSRTRSYTTGNAVIPTIPDHKQKLIMSSKIPGLFFLQFFSHHDIIIDEFFSPQQVIRDSFHDFRIITLVLPSAVLQKPLKMIS